MSGHTNHLSAEVLFPEESNSILTAVSFVTEEDQTYHTPRSKQDEFETI